MGKRRRRHRLPGVHDADARRAAGQGGLIALRGGVRHLEADFGFVIRVSLCHVKDPCNGDRAALHTMIPLKHWPEYSPIVSRCWQLLLPLGACCTMDSMSIGILVVPKPLRSSQHAIRDVMQGSSPCYCSQLWTS